MRNGFTLIEMMIVVVILGIVAAVVAVHVGDKPDIARVKLTGVSLKALKSDIELFKVNHHRYPESLRDLVVRPSYIDASAWPPSGYRSEIPLDGWDREFHYSVPGRRSAFDLVSWGADGKEGGEGFNADLWSSPPPPR